jgi:hypothetical protein
MRKGLSWNHQTVFMSEPHSETSHSIRSCITHMIFPLDRVWGFKTLCQLQQWPSIHVRISILNFWPKTVGLQFTPRNDNHSLQILIWFGRPYERNHVSHPPCLNTMGWCYWDIQLLILPNVVLICIYNFTATWDWLTCFMSIDNLNYVMLSIFLSKVALLLKMLMRKLFA